MSLVNTDPLTTISRVLGVLSLSVWLFAQLPQIIENHLNQSVDGVSLLFLLCWIAGDATNLLACVLTRALPFQTSLAAYYCFIDCILSLQYWYYTQVYPHQKVHHNLLQSPNLIRPVTSKKSLTSLRRNRFKDHQATRSPRSPRRVSGSRNGRRGGTFINKLMATSLLSTGAKAAPVGAQHNQLPSLLSHTLVVWLASLSVNDVGQFAAWICSFLYLLARAPQIRKNYLAKSTTGISIYLFVFAMLGNLFYTVSIVSDLYILYLNEDVRFRSILKDQLPFIVGSAGTVLFDCFIIFQCWYYREDEIEPLPDFFQKPDWYTQTGFTVDDEFEPSAAIVLNIQKPIRPSQASESTRLIYAGDNSYINTPPSHYIAGSQSSVVAPRPGVVSLTFQSIAKSFSRDSYIRSPSSSMVNSNIASSPLVTSLIPSIIGNYSSVSKKMASDAKIPFSPIDFLSDDYMDK